MKKDIIFTIILKSLSYIVLTIIVLFFGLVIISGVKYFTLSFFTQWPSNGMKEGGIFPAILGSLLMVSLSVLFAVPLGIITGVFLSEYGTNKIARLIDISVTSLSGVPSIVYGLFGLSLFVITMNFRTSLLSGALTLSLLILPVIASASAEALKSLPEELRESAYALGARKNEVIFKVLIPAAKKRIITASLVGSGRAIGETAPIMLTGAVFYATQLPKGLFSPVMTLPTHIYYIVAAYGESAQWMAKASSAVLMVFVLILYSIAFLIRRDASGKNNRSKGF
ncbi:phosphate ABC transporter permease PstA [Thermosipho ferrireducens]|uniref:Phosphate transport system permease protein PstA n=1 Tax=Thermosipho ferrireducens TaxID=2571116 RepID=A0ABX7S834_9BACT|nr:phosphate ABC transporter permease PstA [Thermosipho ferrireducens]